MYGALLRTVPLLTMMGTVFLLSHQPGSVFYLPHFCGADKLAHIGLYGVMAASAVFAFPDTVRKRKRVTVAVITVIFCIIFGISDEFHQSFIPGRDASFGDVAADTAGALLLVAGWVIFGGSGVRRQCGGDRV